MNSTLGLQYCMFILRILTLPQGLIFKTALYRNPVSSSQTCYSHCKISLSKELQEVSYCVVEGLLTCWPQMPQLTGCPAFSPNSLRLLTADTSNTCHWHVTHPCACTVDVKFDTTVSVTFPYCPIPVTFNKISLTSQGNLFCRLFVQRTASCIHPKGKSVALFSFLPT